MKYFGTDGIRGEAYKDLTLNLAYKLGEATASLKKEIVVGIDTRYSSMDLAKAFISGVEKKVKVRFAGVIPTSGLMYYSLKHETIGVMITASHNPYKDNGFKIIDKGTKLSESKQLILEELIDNSSKVYLPQKENLDCDASILNEYMLFLDKYFYKSKKKIMFDVANGCYSHILTKYYPENMVINNQPNGFNINDFYNLSLFAFFNCEHFFFINFCFISFE